MTFLRTCLGGNSDKKHYDAPAQITTRNEAAALSNVFQLRGQEAFSIAGKKRRLLDTLLREINIAKVAFGRGQPPHLLSMLGRVQPSSRLCGRLTSKLDIDGL